MSLVIPLLFPSFRCSLVRLWKAICGRNTIAFSPMYLCLSCTILLGLQLPCERLIFGYYVSMASLRVYWEYSVIQMLVHKTSGNYLFNITSNHSSIERHCSLRRLCSMSRKGGPSSQEYERLITVLRLSGVFVARLLLRCGTYRSRVACSMIIYLCGYPTVLIRRSFVTRVTCPAWAPKYGTAAPERLNTKICPVLKWKYRGRKHDISQKTMPLLHSKMLLSDHVL